MTAAWELAWKAIERFRASPAKVEGIPREWESAEPVERRRAQRLFYAYLRWSMAVERTIQPWLKRPPRARLAALLHLAACEAVVSGADSRPAVADHAVGIARTRFSRGEAGMVNAVLRRFARELEERQPSPESAHPDWLVERWQAQYGKEAAARLCAWNQAEPPVYAIRESADAPPDDWQATPWPGYFDVSSADWNRLRTLLDGGFAYIQDPFARHPVDLLRPGAGEVIMDACAAPGGKSRGILRSWTGTSGHLIAADLPGKRLERLRGNLANISGDRRLSLLPADLLQLQPEHLRARDLPVAFDGVLLDAPCSNTGVIARRPDVRHHISPSGIAELQQLQLGLLRNLATLVREGGRLVYSTCSVEREENQDVVDAFLEAHPGFYLAESRLSLPWVHEHDGGAAFLLVRRSGIV